MSNPGAIVQDKEWEKPNVSDGLAGEDIFLKTSTKRAMGRVSMTSPIEVKGLERPTESIPFEEPVLASLKFKKCSGPSVKRRNRSKINTDQPCNIATLMNVPEKRKMVCDSVVMQNRNVTGRVSLTAKANVQPCRS